MCYLLLFIAIVSEIIATTLLKASEGFSRLPFTIGCLALYAVCYYCFAKALTGIDLGIAYATWCAGGIVATSVIAALLFGQKLSTAGVIGIGLIVAGCVIVNLFGTAG